MIRVTEAAALAAARWMGKGDAGRADQAAIAATHAALNAVAFDGRIFLGEGDQHLAPILFTSQTVGRPTGPEAPPFDLALDPLECARSVADGLANAMAIVALAPRGSFIVPPTMYLEKLAVGPEAAETVSLDLSIGENLHRVAEAKRCNVGDLTVVILDRERHRKLIEDVRRTGARIHLIPDGDTAASIAAALPGSGIDMVIGTGGASAGMLAAAGLRCVGGQLLARLAPSDDQESALARRAGYNDLQRIYTARDLVRTDNVMFAATGVTDGDLLNGVRYRPAGATTHSLVLRSASRTRRFIVTEHYFDENPDYS
jgi:fructose-1,6-bisphosphatase II